MMRDRAETVIVGAGIVGTSAAYHLAELGVTDVLVLDQGPLFETGGSSSHAPGLVFQTNGSRTMCRIAQDTVALYATLDLDGEPGWFGVGGIEVATTPERMRELKRRLGFARSLRPRGHRAARRRRRRPRRSRCSTPRRSSARTSCRPTGSRRRCASRPRSRGKRGGEGRRVRGRRHRHRVRHPRRARPRRRDRPRLRRVRARADLRRDLGADGRRDGRRADPAASRSSTSSSGPTRSRSSRARRARSPTRSCATRTWRCTSATAATTTRSATTITSRSRRRSRRSADPAARRMPSLMPWTPADFDVAEAEAARLLPALDGSDATERPVALAQRDVLASRRTPARSSASRATVRGVWVCEAVWVTHGGGMGRQVAEWMATGEPSYDLAEADANRFYPYQTTPPYVLERGKQQYREVYDILHPRQQMAAPARAPARAVLPTARRRSARSSSSAPAGSGRSGSRRTPRSFRPTRRGASATPGPRSSGRRSRAPSTSRPASGVALFDITAFAKLDVAGARRAARSWSACSRTGSTGRSARSSTPPPLTPSGGIRLDLTIARKERGPVPRRHRRRQRPARPRVAPRAGPRAASA